MRGIYGGVPTQLLERGSLRDYGVNAIFMGSGGVNEERVRLLKEQGARVFAEFNTMHEASYVKERPDAAPVGTNGEVAPPADEWQGVCTTHPGYRQYKMDDFRRVLRDYEVDGMWLDYHHSHADWERATPILPDTCFCDRCLAQFQSDTGTKLPEKLTAEISALLLSEHKAQWVQWRCDVFTDWVREFRAIIDETRPAALLGTYHCPWSDTDSNGALRDKLAIDLKAQAPYIDVFSIMPYHARFGPSSDPAWIARQTRWLGQYLGIEGKPGERHQIWPIVQLSDWGEHVPASQVREVLEQGTEPPVTGVMVFNWGGLQKQMENVEEMGKFYRSIAN
jgi:hypothetical protein